MTDRDSSPPWRTVPADTRQPCPRCHAVATQTWVYRRVNQPVPGLWVQRVVASSCPRGCLDGANPWILTAAFPSRPAYTAPAAVRVSYPDPAADRRASRDDRDSDGEDVIGGDERRRGP